MNILNKVFGFNGFLNRKEYFLYSLIVGIVAYLLLAFVFPMLPISTADFNMLLLILTMVAVAISAISIHVRRLHDIGKNGWWVLLLFVPIVGFFFGFYLLLKPGTQAPQSSFSPA